MGGAVKGVRYAIRNRLITFNSCADVDLPKQGSQETFVPVYLTAAQVEAVAAELDKTAPYGLLVRFCATTGLRAAEV